MNVPLCAPDYSCVSKRARSVTVAYRQPPKERITDLIIDSTGLKVFGEGEWKVRKHGAEKRRVWRKLHLAVEQATHDIVTAEVSLENVHDVEVLPTLLNPLRRKQGRVYANGAYDNKVSHPLISGKGTTTCIPPRKNSGLWKKGTQEMRPCWRCASKGWRTGRKYQGITVAHWLRLQCIGSSSCWRGKSVCVTTTAKW
ncbi:IS5 family transposase [Aeromonas veronii]|uniref:IS5 family transposase n=1 Tax=Aeromonas veronii TaxID=654 RepID=UPI0038D39D1C